MTGSEQITPRTKLYLGDCRVWMRAMFPETVDAIVTDPPYELGFMGKSWDRAGVAFDPATWRAAYRVLKPGGHLLAFGGTRTHHRMMVAIEDAGFEIRDCLMWLYGSGFPKSRNLYGDWDGWGTALKPAYEIVVWATKPDPSRERDTITANLLRLEARLWSLLPVSVAVESFSSSEVAQSAAHASAQWSAGEHASTQDALSGLMATSPFVPAMALCLSTVQSWRSTWTDLLDQENTSTMSTESRTIIGSRTLNYLLSRITPSDMLQAAMQADGSTLGALPVARYFSAVKQNMSATQTLSALEHAMSREVTSYPEGEGLRPAWEPIVLARKPLSGSVAENVEAHGTGAMNIDGCRIATTEETGRKDVIGPHSSTRTMGASSTPAQDGTGRGLGRWPANLILDDEAGALLDAQAGDRKSSGYYRATDHGSVGSNRVTNLDGGGCPATMYNDSGGPSRFFYCAKVSRSERNAGLEGMPEREQGQRYGTVQDARPHTVEGYEYSRGPAANNHPTVKPIAVLRWLIRLVTPPGGLVLDLFAGSGSTGCAAELEGMRSWLIELNGDEYGEIIRRRVLHWSSQPRMPL